MTTSDRSIVLPGQTIGHIQKHQPGPAAFQNGQEICAAVAGCVSASGGGTRDSKKNEAPGAGNTAKHSSSGKPLIDVIVPPPASTFNPTSLSPSNVLPAVDSIVLARVTRLTPRHATVQILVVVDEETPTLDAVSTPASAFASTDDPDRANDNSNANANTSATVSAHLCTPEGWQGLIRQEDVRATEKDRVKVGESFRPGDIVRAVVISLGDQANYYLSTARNALGVIMADSDDGNRMVPVSWKEFLDPVSGKKETRKVAKPG